MDENNKDQKKEVAEENAAVKENGTIEIDENSLEDQTDLQKLADQLGGEHAKVKERRFFGKKNKDHELTKKIEQLSDSLKEKDEKIKELENNLKLMVAENRNQKTRIENEFRSKIRYAAEDFFRDFITVKDDFDKAMEFIPQGDDFENNPFIQGIKHLLSKTENTMKKHGLECFSGIGTDFDPSLHQAMSVINVEGKSQNEIVAEYVKGYKLYERILRPSMVVVASGVNPAQKMERPADDSEKCEESEKADDENIEQ